MSVAAAVDYGQNGIRINSFHPGLIRTELIENSKRPASAYQKMLDHTPLGRWGTVDETAKAILFLASDDAGFVTGHSLVGDGGYVAC